MGVGDGDGVGDGGGATGLLCGDEFPQPRVAQAKSNSTAPDIAFDRKDK